MTPDENLRRTWEDELRAERGDEWVERHRAMLDSQWAYLVEGHFLD